MISLRRAKVKHLLRKYERHGYPVSVVRALDQDRTLTVADAVLRKGR